jgi:hypothetical protein
VPLLKCLYITVSVCAPACIPKATAKLSSIFFMLKYKNISYKGMNQLSPYPLKPQYLIEGISHLFIDKAGQVILIRFFYSYTQKAPTHSDKIQCVGF